MAFDRLVTFRFATEVASGQRDVIGRQYIGAAEAVPLRTGELLFANADNSTVATLDGLAAWAAASSSGLPPYVRLKHTNADMVNQAALIDGWANGYLIAVAAIAGGVRTVHIDTADTRGRSSNFAGDGYIDRDAAKVVNVSGTDTLHDSLWHLWPTTQRVYADGLAAEVPHTPDPITAWGEVATLGALSLISVTTGADVRERTVNLRTHYDARLLTADRLDVDGVEYVIGSFNEEGLRRSLLWTATALTEAVS